MPHSTFISIKLIRYFSCVIRNATLPASFTKIKFPHATSSAAEISSATFSNSFARTYTQSVLRRETLKAPPYSCQQQSISSTKLHSLIFSMNIFFKTFVLCGFPFHYSLKCLFGSCFFHAFFLEFFFVYLQGRVTNPQNPRTSDFSSLPWVTYYQKIRSLSNRKT